MNNGDYVKAFKNHILLAITISLVGISNASAAVANSPSTQTPTYCKIIFEMISEKYFDVRTALNISELKARRNKDNPQPWNLERDEKLRLRPDLIAHYQSINTDFFEVENVMEGMHGGHRLIIKRKGPWYDMRKDFSENGADLTQDLRAYPMVMGKEAWFFGYRWVDSWHAIIPDIVELNGAISKFNSGLGADDPRRISITYYDTEKNFVSPEDYTFGFIEKGQLPIALNGRQFFHDISSHALEDFYVDESLFKTMRQRGKIWTDFVALYRSGRFSKFISQNEFNEANKTIIDRLGGQIDKLGMGMSDLLPQNNRVFLGEVGAQVVKASGQKENLQEQGVVQKYDWLLNMAGVTRGLNSNYYPALQGSISDYYLNLLSEQPNVKNVFTKYLQWYQKKYPDAFQGLSFDIDAQVKNAEQVAALSSPSNREVELAKNPLTRAFVSRLQYLRQLVGM